ncbi:Alpha/Beta hydrolase protein [Mycena maculata]|uniref:Alpha/Beta hydrolase protein n=1 Tax=Mycena maculata TaxID=230809 RepID=A0AAD7I218_9AGAR|nr:Alpha/Beta hydrolase protein [Mycena maculata]
MGPNASRFLTYILLLVPPLVVSFYLLASFPTPPRRLPVPVLPGLASLPPESRAREIYPEDWVGEGRYAEFPMGRTRYWLAGPDTGKKVVLIHGLSVPALVWAPLVPQLVAAGHRVLLYDLYGRGYSDAPAGVAYDPQLYVTQLALLLQHVRWPRARLVGVSMGSAVAAAFVATFPDLVEQEVVLLASAGLVESTDLPRTAKVMSTPIVQTLTANPLIYVRYLYARLRPNLLTLTSQAYLRRLASRPDTTHEASTAWMHELVRHQSAHLPGFNRAISSSLRTGPVTGMQWAFESGAWAGRRVLVIHGTTDQTVPPAHAPRIKALIEAASSPSSSSFNTSKPAQVSVELIAGAGHALTWTHAEAVGGAVVQFFAGSGS